MNFLIQEGYPAAAARFAEEASLEVKDENDLMTERVSIRDAIFRGDLQSAIEDINDIDPQLLDGNKSLHFALLRLQLIELIKKMFDGPENEKPQLFGTAVTFAQQNLAPYTPQSEKYKSDLERAMALLIIPKEAWQSKSQTHNEQISAFGPLGDLIDPSLKIEVARDVNAAILRSQGRSDHSTIHRILQTRVWAEDLARDKGIDLPADMGIDLWDAPADSQSQNGNNGDIQMAEDESTGADPVHRYTNLHESAR
ncbi:hypothetical protein LTS08_003010 [Lithohypha guttulata]|nr:hypothetical protein LTR51_000334 [Lithohypha guttulata]KAK5103592.1 hypothetical protein LTS08_003010 [Lithohypha guttulata]